MDVVFLALVEVCLTLGAAVVLDEALVVDAAFLTVELDVTDTADDEVGAADTTTAPDVV